MVQDGALPVKGDGITFNTFFILSPSNGFRLFPGYAIIAENEAKEAVMAQIVEIERLDIPKLDVYAKLTENQLRNRLDPGRGIFIAESPKVIKSALAAGCIPRSFLMERRHLQGQGKELMEAHPRCPVYTGDREVLAALTGYELTRGILCCMERPVQPELSALCENARRIAILEGVVDSTNIGAIFRSAAALNVDALLLTTTCCDPLNRRAVRVSMGTVFQVPWAYIPEKDWPEAALSQLKQQGFATAAMALRENSIALGDPAFPIPQRLAILLGAEGDGLKDGTIAACDCTLRIPMSHGVDSLNVAAASAVAFWELRVR